MLTNKTAVIYGAGGAIGGAVARAFARDGARVFLTGRTLSNVHAVANDISATGTSVDAAQVDALNEEAIENHLDAVVKMTGQIDISFNAVGFEETQGIPLVDLPLEDFIFPITRGARQCFSPGGRRRDE